MIAPFGVRPAAVLDALEVTGWFGDRREAVQWGGPGLPDPLTASWLAREIVRPAADGRTGAHYAMISESGGIAGFFGVVFHAAERRAHLIRFALAPSLRGQGRGATLAEASIEVARSQGAAERLTLAVYADNTAARRTYERAGFSALARVSRAPDMGGEVIRMGLEL